MSAKVYKIFVLGLDDMCYVGSTFDTLGERLSKHKNSALYTSQNKCASSILFEEGNDVVIELIELLEDVTKEELEARERYWIGRYPECVNKNIPGRKWDERHLANREHNLNRMKEWREANKEQVIAYNKEHLSVSRVKEKERYANGYGEARNAKKKEKAICDVCQKEMNKNSISTHKKSVHPLEV